MRQVVSLLFVVSIVLRGPDIVSHAKPIIGSNVHEVSSLGRFPFLVAIKKIEHGRGPIRSYVCAGSLISRKHVLTASHCVEDFLPMDLNVCVGVVNLHYCNSHEIHSWDIYDYWALDHGIDDGATAEDNDVALLRLSNEVTDPNVRPAMILPTGLSLPYGSKVDIAAWGKANHGFPAILQTANLELKHRDQCNLQMRKYPYFYPLVSNEFCTSTDPYTLLDSGDSGGPVIYKDNIIVGLNKAGCKHDIPLEDHINIHVNIEPYRKFIEEILNNDE